MNIADLSRRTDTPVRQIRYLIAEGLVPAPRGGRSTAYYEEEHVTAIKRFNELKALGFPPNAIRLLIENDHHVPFPVAPGVQLMIAAQKVGDLSGLDALMKNVRKILERVSREDSHAKRKQKANRRPS